MLAPPDHHFVHPERLSIHTLAAAYAIELAQCQTVLIQVLRQVVDDPAIVGHLSPRDLKLLRDRVANVCANVATNPGISIGQLAHASCLPPRALLGRFAAVLRAVEQTTAGAAPA